MIVRNPLLVEGVDKKKKKWKEAERALERAVKKGHKVVQQQVKALTREGPREGETRETFAHRALGAEDEIRDKVFSEKARQEKIERRQAAFEKRAAAYEKAKQKKQESGWSKALEKPVTIATPIQIPIRAVRTPRIQRGGGAPLRRRATVRTPIRTPIRPVADLQADS